MDAAQQESAPAAEPGEYKAASSNEIHPAHVKFEYRDSQGRRCTQFVCTCEPATGRDSNADATAIAQALNRRAPSPAQDKPVAANVEEIVQKWAKRYAANDASLDYVEDAIRCGIEEALATASSPHTRPELISAAEEMVRYIDRNWPRARSSRLPVERLRAALSASSPSEQKSSLPAETLGAQEQERQEKGDV